MTNTTSNEAAPQTGTASTTPRPDNTAFLEDLKTLSGQMIELGATPNDEPLDRTGWLRLAEEMREAIYHG